MDIMKLETLRDSLERMDPIHQERIFEILKDKNIEYTKNKNGVFVNMSLFTNTIIEEINNYLLYVRLQQRQLQEGEKNKEIYKNIINNDIQKNSITSETNNTLKDNRDKMYLQ
jgi:hypothetical protein